MRPPRQRTMRPAAHIHTDAELTEMWVCAMGVALNGVQWIVLNGVQWERVGETNVGDGLTGFKVEKLKDAFFQSGGMLKHLSLLKARPLRDILGPEAVARNNARRVVAKMEAMTPSGTVSTCPTCVLGDESAGTPPSVVSSSAPSASSAHPMPGWGWSVQDRLAA